MLNPLVVLVTILCVICAATAFGRRTRNSPLTAGIVCGLWLLYTGAVIPGFAHSLSLAYVAAATILLSAGLWLWSTREAAAPAPLVLKLPPRRALLPLIAFAAFLGITGLKTGLGLPAHKSFLEWLIRAARGTFDVDGITLAADAVAYHFPILIDFWHNRSLWVAHPSLQVYFYGAELITLLPIMGMRSLAGVLETNIIAALLLLIVSASLCLALAPKRFGPVYRCLLALCAIALVWRQIQPWAEMLGKNDIYGAACAVAALRLGLRRPGRDVLQAAACGMAMGLAIGARPNMLALLPVWALLFADDLRNRSFRAPLAALAALLPGFVFLIRNLVQFGSISGTGPVVPGVRSLLLSTSFAHSAHLLTNAQNRDHLITFLLGLLAASICAIAIPARRKLFLMLSAWLVVGMIGFLATPFSLFTHDRIQWRFAAVPETLAAIAIVTGLAFLIERAILRFWPRMKPSDFGRLRIAVPSVAVTGAICIAIFLPLLVGRGYLIGMRGYESVGGMRTGINQFVQGVRSGLRVLSINFPTLGLYGRCLENRMDSRLVFARDVAESPSSDLRGAIDRADLVILSSPKAVLVDLEGPPAAIPELPMAKLGFMEVYRDPVTRAYARQRDLGSPPRDCTETP